jgi:hypothetical protein
VTREPSIGSFTAGPEEPILSTDLLSSEQDGTLPASNGGDVGVPRLADAPPEDSIWAQTAALSLAILLLFGAVTYLRNRRRMMRDYAGYYR